MGQEQGTSARFVERMGTALHDGGLPPLPSRVFSALLVDDDGAMSAAELTAALDVSAGGLSGAVRYLESLDLVERRRAPGTRHDVYVVQDDAWHDALMQHDVLYAPMVAALDAGLRDLPADHPSRLRLALTREFLVFVGAEMDALAERWDRHKARFLRDLGSTRGDPAE